MKIDWDELDGLNWAWMTDYGLWKATKNKPEFMEGHGFYDPEGPDDTESTTTQRISICLTVGRRVWGLPPSITLLYGLVQKL